MKLHTKRELHVITWLQCLTSATLGVFCLNRSRNPCSRLPHLLENICAVTSTSPRSLPTLLLHVLFYLSSVRSQTNNQIDKYDNISAVLSLKANLQFFGKRLSGYSGVISHQGGSNLGELTATNNQSFITELNATVLWPRGGEDEGSSDRRRMFFSTVHGGSGTYLVCGCETSCSSVG